MCCLGQTSMEVSYLNVYYEIMIADLENMFQYTFVKIKYV